MDLLLFYRENFHGFSESDYRPQHCKINMPGWEPIECLIKVGYFHLQT